MFSKKNMHTHIFEKLLSFPFYKTTSIAILIEIKILKNGITFLVHFELNINKFFVPNQFVW